MMLALPPSSCRFMFIPNLSSSTSSYSTFSCCLSPASTAESKLQSSLESPVSSSTHQKKMKNEGNNGNNISQIQVSREKYIPVSKSQLHDALLSFLRSQHQSLNNDEDDGGDDSVISHFLLLSSCLDSILHAEHKSILEEMRADYFSTQSVINEGGSDTFGHEIEREANCTESIEFVNGGGKRSGDGVPVKVEENQLPFLNGLDLKQLFGSSMDDAQNNDAMNYSILLARPLEKNVRNFYTASSKRRSRCQLTRLLIH